MTQLQSDVAEFCNHFKSAVCVWDKGGVPLGFVLLDTFGFHAYRIVGDQFESYTTAARYRAVHFVRTGCPDLEG